jgi:phosphoserine phosphatase
MAEHDVPAKAGRPSFGTNMRSRSYLQEHQQYRPPHHDGHQGIDSIVEGLQQTSVTAPKNIPQFNGIPSPKSPPKIIDSGLNHTLSHTNCQPQLGTSSDRLIATLIYKTKAPRAVITDVPPDRSPSPSPPSPSRTLPPNLAPVRTLSNFPLEPPPPDPEPLDHLYGSYISPLCLTSFLCLLVKVPRPYPHPTAASIIPITPPSSNSPFHPLPTRPTLRLLTFANTSLSIGLSENGMSTSFFNTTVFSAATHDW